MVDYMIISEAMEKLDRILEKYCEQTDDEETRDCFWQSKSWDGRWKY